LLAGEDLMTSGEHSYEIELQWAGNTGSGTSTYFSYKRNYLIRAAGKTDIAGSSDPSYRGDPTRWNPEELLVASLAACHKLWYLHLCAEAGVTVMSYGDRASGTMIVDATGTGRFTRVVLRPHVTVGRGDDIVLATRLHQDAHAKCFIANSVNFPVEHEPAIFPAA
jgi:organic hydroperoxide reductase OsmC/OhrA